MLDYQAQIESLLLGPGTDYIIHGIDGFGTPDVRAGDVLLTGDHGGLHGADYLGSRRVTISVTVRGDNPSDVVANIDTLLSSWSPTTDEATTKLLTIQEPGQVARAFKGRTRRAQIDKRRIIGNRAAGVLEFVCMDPRIYSAAEHALTVNMVNSTEGRTYPRVYPMTYTLGEANILTVTNAGNFPTRPVVRFDGPTTNPRIQNVDTGAELRVNITLASGEFLVVDFGSKEILLNGTASRYNLRDASSSWWELPPGDTDVRFISSTYAPEASMTVSWRDAWL